MYVYLNAKFWKDDITISNNIIILIPRDIIKINNTQNISMIGLTILYAIKTYS